MDTHDTFSKGGVLTVLFAAAWQETSHNATRTRYDSAWAGQHDW